MAVTAQMVKELREMTGAGMMDCKKALVEADADMDKAVEILREKGLSKAAKKAGRVAAMGLVKTAFAEDGKAAAIIEVNSETDFVAKNEEFVDFVDTLAKMALENDAADMDAFMALPYGGEGTVQEVLTNKIATIGENLSIRRFEKLAEPGVVYTGYIHGGGSIGVIVGLKTEASAAEIETVGKDVAMQVASMAPSYVSRDEMPKEVVEHERNIQTEIVKNDESLSSKPEKVLAGIIEGRVSKTLQEMCLNDQVYFLDSSKKCGQYLKENNTSVSEFVRYLVGEGLEKREENFADEVAKQIG